MRIAARTLVVTSMIVLPCAADAAVRTCSDVIETAGEDRTSELNAKQKAMSGWTAAAAKLGPAYALWRNAIDKSLSCLKLTDGKWRCQAYARACAISQVPGADPRSPLPALPAIPRSRPKSIQA